MNLKSPAALALAAPLVQVIASPLAYYNYGACQTGCNTGAGACYTAAGFVFGNVTTAEAPPAILTCNASQGTCMAACARASSP
ncbi:hypothetical protein PAXINDRAFT_80856 [Paxillus involutus ATCC 200175]|uniref:Uncharacterized protein n=1 Tax=Paxillus involutus ATCC 200175 TaxID=664439 RepID=A0A0C9TDK7_PAXIN|nr:hypothetical protein PAXINDRAFT_80856 [Paxillus involutus ATCC 200175]